MYRKNRALKRMIEEHMHKNQSPEPREKPKRYYYHSSMEFEKDASSFKGGEVTNHTVKLINGNVHSLRSSTGNLHTNYNSHTPVSGSHRGSVTTKFNSSSTPFSMKDRK